jgi:hypothetical protein
MQLTLNLTIKSIMAEITYLLGAGASCGALPVVSDMENKITLTIDWLNDMRYNFNVLQESRFQKIINDLGFLRDNCDTKKNFSIDTYAKKLKLSGEDKTYNRVRNALSLYFTIEQKHYSPDIRYDNFWASILKSKLELPNNIRVLSWNYDFQLELTYQGFLKTNSLKESRKALNVSSLEMILSRQINYEKFGVFKLNGSATILLIIFIRILMKILSKS